MRPTILYHKHPCIIPVSYTLLYHTHSYIIIPPVSFDFLTWGFCAFSTASCAGEAICRVYYKSWFFKRVCIRYAHYVCSIKRIHLRTLRVPIGWFPFLNFTWQKYKNTGETFYTSLFHFHFHFQSALSTNSSTTIHRRRRRKLGSTMVLAVMVFAICNDGLEWHL